MSGALVASGTSGLLHVEDGGVTVLDPVPTTGLAATPEGDLLARLLYDPDRADEPGEIVLYDHEGLLAYRRIDELREAHGALWHDGELLVVSTRRNAVLRLTRAGEVAGRWQAPDAEPGDAWHLNNLAVRDGRVLVSAFGRFARHRDWAAPGARDGTGIVLDLASGRDVLGGLTCPHDPTPFGDGWLVCDSAAGRLLRLDAHGRTVQAVKLGGWTRGLVLAERYVHVGVSASRMQQRTGQAALVTLERDSLAEVARVALPCREVFTLAWLPPALLEGLRTRPRSPTVAAAGPPPSPDGPGPLAEADCRVEVAAADVPEALEPATPIQLGWRVANRGGVALASAGATPVHVGARWVHAATGVTEEESRDRFTAPLAPGAIAEGTIELWSPVRPGDYVLRLGVVQEGVRWFDDVDPRSGWERPIRVAEAGPPRFRSRVLSWRRR